MLLTKSIALNCNHGCKHSYYFLFSDGARADAKELARLTGNRDQNPQFVTSTGNKLYIYTKTDQADSRRGYRIKYYEGCNVVINRYDGKINSPAFGKPETGGYPPNQECIYTLRHPAGTKLSMMFTHLDLHASDTIQVGAIRYVNMMYIMFLVNHDE